MANAHNQTIGRMSPRQKMINLMYIVLTAMLALNVSSDVLNGFSQVEDGLARSNSTVAERNYQLFERLKDFNETNPEKGGIWLERAQQVHATTTQLYQYIDSLKTGIVCEADGDDGNPRNIKNLDDLESASVVMLAPGTGKGEELKNRVDSYRDFVCSFIEDTTKRNNIEIILSTSPKSGSLEIKKSWQEVMFENMPVVAAVTLLSKLQNDVLYAEGEVLNTLITNIDAGDIRVNQVEAFVIPYSRIVMRGNPYQANIVLAAVDTTQRPITYINGNKLDNDRGFYQVGTGASGVFDYSGTVEVTHGDGTVSTHPFSSSYTVIEPTATISATMMNVLYAGIDNPISIAVPGIPSQSISASMTNGTLTRKGDEWVARPTKVGEEAVVTVTANSGGTNQTVAVTSFRVRKLPDPAPYIEYKDAKGNPDRYKGGPIAKAVLLGATELSAAIDDDMLNVAYKVVSFRTVIYDSMGNAIPEVSDGAKFSERQKASFRRLSRGKRVLITDVNALGPDGIQRRIAPMDVIVQ